MKNRRILHLFAACICTMFLLTACGGGKRPAGLRVDVDGLPEIEKFSAQKYERYEYHFSPIKYAVLHYGVDEENIEPDDPRLIQLLNFLAYSEERGLSQWYQSPLSEEEFIDWLSCDDTMLEVGFHYEDGSNGSEHGDTPKIVICGDSYLMYVNTQDPGWPLDDNVYAYRWFPYADLVVEDNEENFDMISFDGWGNTYWIDLLEYSGFYDE